MTGQPEEGKDEIFVFIVDGSYDKWHESVDETGIYDEEALTTAASLNFKKDIEREFEVQFEEANIGPGADLPAFVTSISSNVLPLLPWLMAVFFSGKPIVDNLQAWQSIFKKISGFFARPVVVNRQGAAVIAVEAIFEEMGGLVKTLRLLDYRPNHYGNSELLPKNEAFRIEDAPPSLNLGIVEHSFVIEADGIKFQVFVSCAKAKLFRI